MIPLIVLALLGSVLFAASKGNKLPVGTPGNYLPPKDNAIAMGPAKPEFPHGLKGTPTKRTKVKVPKTDRTYTTFTWPPDSKDRVYSTAQLEGSKAWLGYYHQRATGARKLYKAYAPGDRDQAGRVVSIIMSDWGVKK